MWNGKHQTTLHGHIHNRAEPNEFYKIKMKSWAKCGGVKRASISTMTNVINVCVVPIKFQYGKTSKVVKHIVHWIATVKVPSFLKNYWAVMAQEWLQSLLKP